MFGFSRGAFTARFLARMVNKVGLLCKGNEEMVPFVYRLYQRYLTGEIKEPPQARSGTQANGDTNERTPLVNRQHDPNDSDTDEYEYEEPEVDELQSAENEITAFSNTFCRKEPKTSKDPKNPEDQKKGEEENVKVFFLGIWDCVNSVAVLETGAPPPKSVMGTASYVRHAVAVDERRVKFKPALIAQDVRDSSPPEVPEDIKEVWFPGCHGDIGGGWPATRKPKIKKVEPGFWERVKSFWVTTKPKEATTDVTKDVFQMSDVALSWMIHELEVVGHDHPESGVKWSNNVTGYKKAFARPLSQKQALKGFIHDSLNFGTGTGFFTVLLWKFMGRSLQTIKRFVHIIILT